MKPIDFPEANLKIAEHQPEYLTLPSHVGEAPETIVTSCWEMSFFERVRVLFTGKVWFSIVTFGSPLQPQLPSIDNPFKRKQ